MKKIFLFSLILLSFLFTQKAFASNTLVNNTLTLDTPHYSNYAIEGATFTGINVLLSGNYTTTYGYPNISCLETGMSGSFYPRVVNNIDTLFFDDSYPGWNEACGGSFSGTVYVNGWSRNIMPDNSEIIEFIGTLATFERSSIGEFSNFNGTFIPYEVPTIGITSTTPEANATGVNAFTTFTGTYDNDGFYSDVMIGYTNLDAINQEIQWFVCQPAETGTNLNYSCNHSLATNTHYEFRVILSNGETYVEDSSNPYYFTTGTVYEVQTPPTSSTCGTFDVGCYLENAISWAFGLSQETLNQFNNLSLENKKPFSYIYDMDNLYEELFNDTPQNINIAIAFGSGSITLLSTDMLEDIPFQNIVRTILGAILIFGTAMLIYKKVIGIHDTAHTAVRV